METQKDCGLARRIALATRETVVELPDLPAGPLIIGHRGYSESYPENTLAAFDAALQLGIDGCECDVHVSADGEVFLLHDDSLQRTCGVNRMASDLDWSALRALDAGSWKAPEFAGERLPLLAEALRLHHGRGTLVIEIKAHGDVAPAVFGVLQAIEETNAYAASTVISFGFEYLQEVTRREPRLPCLWLQSQIPASDDERDQLLAKVLEARFQGLSVLDRSLDRAFVRRAHRAGLAIWSWTVNTPEAAAAMVACEVDAICTDRPAWLKEWLAARGA